MDIVSEVVPISELRHKQNEIIRRLGDGPVILTQRGRGTAVLISLQRWRQMVRQLADLEEALEEVDDIRATDQTLARIRAGKERTYSREEVWAELDALEAGE